MTKNKNPVLDGYQGAPELRSLFDELLAAVDLRDATQEKRDVRSTQATLLEYEQWFQLSNSDAETTAFLQQCLRLHAHTDPSYAPAKNIAHLLLGRHTFAGLAGKLQGTFLQGNQVCLEVSPFAHACEQRLIRLLLNFLGFDEQAETWALPTVGGSEANLIGLMLARERFFEMAVGANVAHQGLVGLRGFDAPVVLLPHSAHYCWAKSANVLGLGKQALVHVPVDNEQRMDVQALRALLDQYGGRVMAVISVFGTTEFGGIDPIDDINRALIEHTEQTGHAPWHHIDAALGGPVIRHPRYKKHSEAMQAADSVTIDPHKLLFSPYNCGALIVKTPERLQALHSEAPYIDHYGPATFDPSAPGKYRLAGSMDTSGIIAAYYTLATIPNAVMDDMVQRCLALAQAFSAHLSRSEQPNLTVITPTPDLNLVGAYWDDKDDAWHRAAIVSLAQTPDGYRISSTTHHGRLVHRFCFMSPALGLNELEGLVDTYLSVMIKKS